MWIVCYLIQHCLPARRQEATCTADQFRNPSIGSRQVYLAESGLRQWSKSGSRCSLWHAPRQLSGKGRPGIHGSSKETLLGVLLVVRNPKLWPGLWPIWLTWGESTSFRIQMEGKQNSLGSTQSPAWIGKFWPDFTSFSLNVNAGPLDPHEPNQTYKLIYHLIVVAQMNRCGSLPILNHLLSCALVSGPLLFISSLRKQSLSLHMRVCLGFLPISFYEQKKPNVAEEKNTGKIRISSLLTSLFKSWFLSENILRCIHRLITVSTVPFPFTPIKKTKLTALAFKYPSKSSFLGKCDNCFLMVQLLPFILYLLLQCYASEQTFIILKLLSSTEHWIMKSLALVE